MDTKIFQDDTSAHAKKRLDVLDTMDELRSLGVAHFIDLPQIIVCGDQSSGKSSVLEAISGISFPRNDNLCTRFATEVIMRRSNDSSASVTIMPHLRRSQEEQDALRNFGGTNASLTSLQDTIEKAKLVMGINDGGQRFSNDILRIEVTGPAQPHLTLVDLPGLFWAGTQSQSEDDAKPVQDLVLSYMQNKRSIVLAVVSAKNDIANQIVAAYAQKEDPRGERTLGIITKPDVLFPGSDSERDFFKLAENKNIQFRHGWHVMKNRDFDTRDSTTKDRNAAEAKLQSFFQTDIKGGRRVAVGHTFDMEALITTLSATTQADMDRFSCSELADCTRAYYKVALKTVVDEISTLCIERRLLLQMPGIFSPESVLSMTDDQVSAIAVESKDIAEARKLEAQKAEVLGKASKMLSLLHGQGIDG